MIEFEQPGIRIVDDSIQEHLLPELIAEYEETNLFSSNCYEVFKHNRPKMAN